MAGLRSAQREIDRQRALYRNADKNKFPGHFRAQAPLSPAG